ncbi:GT99 family glycosyltransferase N-terminal domain-containing protein [Lacrimispora sphenoides]|uniref:Glycosyltransferase 99 N-terminal domain-containing protein n=1 Tax=Lacrimispora sphenoides JCM 1415 TaxID=1297793 RepID=A0ABY1CDI7_9FIRM|nr:hypothetical protein [Lacrimispora sphenoides]SET95995.1 hypothetical protein SAMN02745906_3430 [[Clostridium] sphenoides JCM 1415]SUY52740.1 Uncharacterised protein [Lacrimispora sphenoides]
MFVPIIITLDPAGETPWLWVFHKMASMGKGYKWPIVAQKEYFAKYKTFEVPSIWKEWFDVPLDKEGVLENIIPIKIPEYIINSYIEKYPSQTDAYVNSFVEEWSEIVEYLYKRLNQIVVDEGKSIEGLILFRYYRCFESLAKKLNVPTFYFELGLRVPDYRNTFYWSKSGLQGKAGFDERYTKFHKEFMVNPVLALDAKEILALFLKEDKLDYLRMNMSKEYEFGIFGGYSIPMASTAFNQVTLAEELMLVRKWCSDDKIIIKKHPGDPLDAAPRFPNIEKGENTSAQFIQKCRRIVCAGSNTAFEAALYGVPAYDLGWSQYSFISNLSLKELTDNLPDKLKLSFVAFGCLAPLELLKDIDYIRKVIMLDSELEIYKLNLEYYLRDYGLTYEQLAEADNRLELILKSRLHKPYEHLKLIPRGDLTPLAELQIELKDVQRQLTCLLEKEGEQTQISSKLDEEFECIKKRNSRLESELLQIKEKYRILENENSILQVSNKNSLNDLNVLNDLISELKMKLQDMEQLCSEKDALYHQILESTSYRCTKPLRVFADLFKNIV